MVGDASDPYVMVHFRYEIFLEAEQSVGCSNEVDKYLAENCDGRRDVNLEVLGWWKDNSSRYPMLSKVPKDVLAIPVSTVASKAVFELTENHFRKLFSVKSTRLAATENRFSGKSFPFDQNLHLLTRKSFYILVLPSNDFRSCESNTLSQNT